MGDAGCRRVADYSHIVQVIGQPPISPRSRGCDVSPTLIAGAGANRDQFGAESLEHRHLAPPAGVAGVGGWHAVDRDPPLGRRAAVDALQPNAVLLDQRQDDANRSRNALRSVLPTGVSGIASMMVTRRGYL
jgi:hypothetical protein